MNDKVIWITGASSGIGKSLALHMGGRGARLILSSRDVERLKEVRNALPHPEKAAILPMDLESWTEFPKLATEAIQIFGHVNVLVNNAGISQRSLIADTGMEVYKRLISVNYLGTVALSRALLPHFTERKAGHFAVVTSLMGRFGSPLRSGYCGAKHALHGFFDVLRMEHEKDGIHVTMVCPGFVQTDVARNALTGDGSTQQQQDTATAAGMDPDRFARKMAKAIEKKKWEVYIGGREVFGIYLKRFFPRLLHRVVLRSNVV